MPAMILLDLSKSYPQEYAKTLDLGLFVMMANPLMSSGLCLTISTAAGR